MSQLSLTEGNVRRALSRFAIPFLGASLLQFLYGAVDLIVVGQLADQAGIAAVSTGSQVIMKPNCVLGLSTGGTVLVGQYLGARRGEDVNRAIGTLFSLFALIAVVLAAAFALSTNAIVALTSADDLESPHPSCIRCGRCVSVCPMGLQPLYLYRFSRCRDVGMLRQYSILDCVECGCCAYTCPGKLPIVAAIREGKQRVREEPS